MANNTKKKSKTQRARASERRQAKNMLKAEQKEAAANEPEKVEEEKVHEPVKVEKPKKKAQPKKDNAAVEYLKGVRTELHAITWPTRESTKKATIAVFAALIFFGVLIYLLDSGTVPVLTAWSSL